MSKIEIQNDREREVWQDGHEQGWNDCLHEWQEQDKLKRPNLCDRVAAIFRRRTRSHDAG